MQTALGGGPMFSYADNLPVFKSDSKAIHNIFFYQGQLYLQAARASK